MATASSVPIKVLDGKTATIAISGTTSGAVDFEGGRLAGIIMPAAFTGTAISFTVSDSLTGTYVPLKNTSGTVISFTVAASTAIGFSPDDFKAWRFVKIVSNDTEVAARDITLVLVY